MAYALSLVLLMAAAARPLSAPCLSFLLHSGVGWQGRARVPPSWKAEVNWGLGEKGGWESNDSWLRAQLLLNPRDFPLFFFFFFFFVAVAFVLFLFSFFFFV